MDRQIYTLGIVFGTVTGLLVSGIFIYDGKGEGYKYAIVGASIGGALGCIAASVMIGYKKAGFVLMKKMHKMGNLRAKDIQEIITVIGGYTSRQEVTITDRNSEKGWYYTFTDGAYSVQLLVGADGYCYGVTSETIDGKSVKKS